MSVRPPGEFPQIQAAVLAANPGDTIQVDPGTYKEQVTISTNSHGVTLNNLTLEGSNQTSIIQLPAPGTQSTAIVEVTGATNVTIDKFTIEGPGGGPGIIGYGVEVDGGGSANITNDHNTHIRDNPLSGDQNGIAILVGQFPTTTASTFQLDRRVRLPWRGVSTRRGGMRPPRRTPLAQLAWRCSPQSKAALSFCSVPAFNGLYGASVRPLLSRKRQRG